MRTLTKDDIFAEEVTNAYKDYEKEYEVKILIEIDPQTQIEKYRKELNFDDTLYVLVTIHKDYNSITYISTEYKKPNGEIEFLPSNYTKEEQDLLAEYAIKKWKCHFYE